MSSVVNGGNCNGTPPYIVGNASSAAPTSFYLLQEDGVSKIILESGGGFVLLE
jgi:hypothetical protein